MNKIDWTYLKYIILGYLGFKAPLSYTPEDKIRVLQEGKQSQKNYAEPSTPNARKCNYKPCRRRLKGLVYHCPYCKGDYCESHRLPEDHDCEEPGLPSEMRQGYGIKKERSRESQAQAEKN